MMDQIYRLDAWFSGRVQGVGFRYQTLQVAKEFEVSGIVKNLPDGRVHLIAEGLQSELNDFKNEVESQLDSYIKGVEDKTQPTYRQFEGFKIDS